MPLPLEAYARLLAHMAVRRTPLAEVLAELGISADDLSASEPALRAELAQAWPRRKGITAMKFATALGEELAKLGPIHLGGAHETEHEVPRPRETELPSYLREPPPQVPLPVLPVPPAASLRAPSALAETASMDLSAVVAAVQRGALPFASSPTSTADAGERNTEGRPTLEIPPNAPESPGGTRNADLSAVIASVELGGLPWKSGEPGRPADEVDLSPMPLATFAEISGALARGEPREEALAKHGLSAETFSKLAQGWAQRFQQDPALAATFKELARASANTTKKG